MFNLRLCNAAIIRYSQLKFGHMHLCGMDYKYFSPHCCKCNSFGCTAAIRCDNACHGPHSDSLYSGSEHCQFNSPRLVKREAGFPNPRRALIGSNQLWRVNDSAYYRELCQNLLLCIHLDIIDEILKHGFNIAFNYEAISKIISCSCRFTMVHRQRFTGMAATSVWTGTLGDNIQSSRGENILDNLIHQLHNIFLLHRTSRCTDLQSSHWLGIQDAHAGCQDACVTAARMSL